MHIRAQYPNQAAGSCDQDHTLPAEPLRVDQVLKQTNNSKR